MTPAQRATDDARTNRIRISPARFRAGVEALDARVLEPTDRHPYEHYVMASAIGVMVIACDPSIADPVDDASLLRIDLTPGEASLISGALNVSSTLRNTIASVTTEQLDIGRQERELGWRVLNAIAVSDAVTEGASQLEQVAELAQAFVETAERLSHHMADDAACDALENLKHALAAVGRWPIS